MSATTCPVPGCNQRHRRDMLMCRTHWYMVPKPLREELWRAYRGEGVLSDAYQSARDRCIAMAASS